MAEGSEKESLGRLLDGLNGHLQPALSPFVSETMRRHFGPDWLEHASRTRGAPVGALDLYANLKTMLDNWIQVFRKQFQDRDAHRIRGFVSTAFEARNAASHPVPPISAKAGLRYLDSMHELAKCVGAAASDVEALERLYDEQRASGLAKARAPERSPAPRSIARYTGQVDRTRFKDFLMSDLGKAGAAGPMTEGSARSYCSYINQIEAILGTSLDGENLDEAGVASVIKRLNAHHLSAPLPGKTVTNLSSGVKAYARYRGHYPTG